VVTHKISWIFHQTDKLSLVYWILGFLWYLYSIEHILYFPDHVSVFHHHLFYHCEQTIMTVNNFTEFYNLLKNNDGITNSVPRMRDFIILVENYKSMCSCDRKSEKLRLQNQCESEYRSLISTILPSHIQIFHSVLKQSNIKFLVNNTLLGNFNS